MYALFAGPDYYPAGGIGDFVTTAETIESAQALLPADSDWAHVADLSDRTLRIVAEHSKHQRQWRTR